MEEFYDLEKDPLEKMNLINDLKYSEILNDLKKRLEDWMIKTNDPLLKGKVKPQKNNLLKFELYDFPILGLVRLVQNILRIRCLHKIIRKFLRHNLKGVI